MKKGDLVVNKFEEKNNPTLLVTKVSGRTFSGVTVKLAHEDPNFDEEIGDQYDRYFSTNWKVLRGASLQVRK